jgi:O-acetyl-ADP-ribose deacetylase (regulator of RNase III)
MSTSGGGGRRPVVAPGGPKKSGCDGCPSCLLLLRRVEELTSELALLRSGRTGPRPQGEPPRPVKVDKWKPTDKTPLLQDYFACRKLPWENSRGRCSLKVVAGDLVTSDEKTIMHFVSADMKRGKGIALALANVFGPFQTTNDEYKIGAVKQQVLENGKALLNLVTKRRYFHKPAANPERFLSNIVTALDNLRGYCVDKKIRRLALPRVGSNLDRVNWRWTQRKLLEVFEDVDIELVVYLGVRPPRRPAGRRPPPAAAEQQRPPDARSERDYPALGERKRPKQQTRIPTGLLRGAGVDACGGSVLARGSGTSVEPSAPPEANLLANDGLSASTRPTFGAQVSHLSLNVPPVPVADDLQSQLAQIRQCAVFLSRLSVPGIAAVGVDDTLQTPSRRSLDENSALDDERLLLQTPVQPSGGLQTPILPILQLPVVGDQTF